MDASKQFLKDNAILPRISFKESPTHTVTLEKDKLDTITGTDGNEVTGVQYLVKEGGEVKTFFTSSVTLVQKLAEFKTGDTVTITMRSVKSDKGFKTTYDVKGDSTAKEDIEEPKEEPSDDAPTPEEEALIEEIPF